MTEEKRINCDICEGEIEPDQHGWQYGYNARPYKDGRACALCNSFFVLPMRLEGIKNGGFVKPDDGQDIEECSKARELWIEENCECGISEKTGKWSEKVFESFGCNCGGA